MANHSLASVHKRGILEDSRAHPRRAEEFAMGNEALKNGGKSASYGYSWGMTYEYTSVDDTGIGVVGPFTFSMLAAMTGLAKDGDQTLDIKAHIEHARVSACAFELSEQFETWVGHRGCDLYEAAGQYSGLYDDLDARTRPSTWSERSVKTYVTLGIIGDLLRGVNERHGLFDTNPDVQNLNQGDRERDHLAPQTGEDPQLAARLSPQACRVAGEVLGLVRATPFIHPALAKELDAAGEIVALVARHHSERMAQINLKA